MIFSSYNHHNRDETTFSLSLCSSLASAKEGETFHLAVIGMELSKVLNLFISIVCVCVCVRVRVYTIVHMSRVLCVCCMRVCRVCVCVCVYVLHAIICI